MNISTYEKGRTLYNGVASINTVLEKFVTDEKKKTEENFDEEDIKGLTLWFEAKGHSNGISLDRLTNNSDFPKEIQAKIKELAADCIVDIYKMIKKEKAKMVKDFENLQD